MKRVIIALCLAAIAFPLLAADSPVTNTWTVIRFEVNHDGGLTVTHVDNLRAATEAAAKAACSAGAPCVVVHTVCIPKSDGTSGCSVMQTGFGPAKSR